ncbi:MAG: phage baseplate assembly protein W [Thalassolituus oleivorans]
MEDKVANEEKIIGAGWSFPPEFDAVAGAVKMTSGQEDINNSLFIIFTTALGERIMQPKFGCSLHSMVMEPMNTGNLAYIRAMLETAILYHEPRIDAELIEFKVNANEGILDIKVSYKIRASNSRFNFVYPFYLSEGDKV